MRLLVEGWRGIAHSYAMVNQYHLLELAQRPDVALTTRDLPFFRPEWSGSVNPAGFDAARSRVLAAIPPPTGPSDVVYRIAYPYRAGPADGARVFCQATCEFRRMNDSDPFVSPPDPATQFITPSRWARDGLLASGITHPIHVVPHGVDLEIFRPPTPQERPVMRTRCGIGPDRFVFLNISLMSLNKGVDLLLLAFNEVRRKHPHALLLLKDQRGLYGWDADTAIAQAQAKWPGRLDGLGRDHVGIIGTGLTLGELWTLYGACDAYVSPYRGEGFNIPPLEAAACGLPVAVTAGGATDDYANDLFALRLPARDGELNGHGCLEPDVDGIVDAMLRMIEGRFTVDAAAARGWIGENFSWKKAVDRLVTVLATAP